jgi:outer membrane protein OmpA-like peptidoglycan-associated protein
MDKQPGMVNLLSIKSTSNFLLILFGILMLPLITEAQTEVTTKSKKAIDAYNDGLNKYTQNHYSAAEQSFLTAIQADKQFIEAYLVLAQVYEDSGAPLKAIEIYKRGLIIKETYYPYGYIKLGNLEYREGKYEEALKSYNRFVSLNSGTEQQFAKASEGIQRCEFSLNAKNNPVDFKPVNLGPQINSTLDDYWPSLSADEKTLVITRLMPNDDPVRKIQEDFYISNWNDTVWSEMKAAGVPLNTLDNEGAQALSGDGRYMVFTACNRKDGIGRCDLYAAVKEGEQWSVPVNLGVPVNSKYRETQPSLTADGRTLYFSSDRPGGKGYHDIWVSYRSDNGKWTQPVNIGDSVNSFGVEMSPFIHPDNHTLYFSSDGHIGLGGYDLFVSRRDSSGIWRKPVNLGYPINTHRDEIGLIVNARGNKAYYSSGVDEAMGKDIFVFDLPEESRPLIVTYMKGIVFDAEDRRKLKAEFELIDLETEKMIFNSFSDSVSGEFLVSIPFDRNYLLNVSRKSYLFYSENFSLKNIFNADQPFLKDVPLQPIKAGSSIVLKNVFFETDSYELKKESRIELDKVVKLLMANPDIKIEIGGHTDNVGTAEYNQQLSENRARAVANYLVEKGITATGITSKGYGLNQPISSNDNPEGRSQNRRTEMKVLE